jgi:hypothetical protein
MNNEQINAAMSDLVGRKEDFCNDRDAMEYAHSFMAVTYCKEGTDWEVWDEYGHQLDKHGLAIWQISNRQWAEAFLRTLGKWEEGE